MWDRLSPREKEIGELLLQGCEGKEIGNQLGMKHRTVKAHLNRMFLKFGIVNPKIAKRVVLAVILYREQLQNSSP